MQNCSKLFTWKNSAMEIDDLFKWRLLEMIVKSCGLSKVFSTGGISWLLIGTSYQNIGGCSILGDTISSYCRGYSVLWMMFIDVDGYHKHSGDNTQCVCGFLPQQCIVSFYSTDGIPPQYGKSSNVLMVSHKVIAIVKSTIVSKRKK